MIVLVTLLLLSAQDPQWNCANPQAQQEMNYCAGEDFRRADAELNSVYRTAIASAQAADREYNRMDPGGASARRDEPGEEASLREAQRGWVSFRDANCRLESFEARGGSLAPTLNSTCRITLTQERTRQLKALVEVEN